MTSSEPISIDLMREACGCAKIYDAILAISIEEIIVNFIFGLINSGNVIRSSDFSNA